MVKYSNTKLNFYNDLLLNIAHTGSSCFAGPWCFRLSSKMRSVFLLPPPGWR